MNRNTALITGASSGIGLELARVMIGDGWNVVLVARRESLLEEVASQLRDQSRGQASVHVCAMDLSEADAARRLTEYLSKEDIFIDTLVNNAGLGDFSAFVDSDWEKNRKMIRVNIEALTELTRLLVPPMIARRHGRVLNVASVAAFQPGPLMAVYYATKAYVLSFSEALAEELRGSGVTTTVLCPGPTKSEFQAGAHVAPGSAMNNRFIPSARTVARYGYRAMLRNKGIAVHGTAFKLMLFVSRFLPRILVTRMVKGFQTARSGSHRGRGGSPGDQGDFRSARGD
ncbi:MAG: SDR family NAD(P)-dependent oxidoreductase [bacterium]